MKKVSFFAYVNTITTLAFLPYPLHGIPDFIEMSQKTPLYRLLNVFPEELWEMILNKVYDSSDIQNVLAAFPALDSLFAEKKVLWFLKEALPHLYKYGPDAPYRKQLISSCLQVCTTWRNATEEFVANHPSRHSYNAHGVNRRSLPYKDFSYQGLTDAVTGALFFTTKEKLDRFTDSMRMLQPRLFKVKTIYLINKSEDINDVNTFLDGCLLFLDIFGPLIRRIGIKIPNLSLLDFQMEKHIMAKLVQCLSKLSNCAYLYLDFDFYTSDVGPEDYNEPHKLMPIECVEFSLRMPLGIQEIILQYTKPIQKLITQQNTLYLDSPSLKNLTELQIGVEISAENLKSISRLSTTLRRLTVENEYSTSKRSFFELLDQLKLDELVLDSYHLLGKYEVTTGLEFSSLKYLLLTDYSNQNMDFVKAFPNLDHLELCWSDEWKTVYKTFNKTLSRQPPQNVTEILRYYLYKPHVPSAVNIWNILPSLQILTVNGYESPAFQLRYARAGGNKPFYSFLNRKQSK